MNVQERILNSQLLMAMEKYPDLSKNLGLTDASIEVSNCKEEKGGKDYDSRQTNKIKCFIKDD